MPFADRTREVWGRKLCWWRLSSGFPLCTILFGFTDSFDAPLLMRPCHFARSCAICTPDSVSMLKSLREALRVSLYRFFWPPWERFHTCSSPERIFLGNRSSGILVTRPVYLNCDNVRRVYTLCISALFRTSVFGILSCHLIFRSLLRHFVWKWFSLLACRW